MAKRRKAYRGTPAEHGQRAVALARQIKRGAQMVTDLVKNRECGAAHVALLGLVHSTGQYDAARSEYRAGSVAAHRWNRSVGVDRKVQRVAAAYRKACVRK